MIKPNKKSRTLIPAAICWLPIKPNILHILSLILLPTLQILSLVYTQQTEALRGFTAFS